MNKRFAFRFHKIIISAIFLISLLILPALSVRAELGDPVEETNAETGFTAYIRDDARLFSDPNKQKILDSMMGITEYGNVACVTCPENTRLEGNTRAIANHYYDQIFGTKEGSVFLIDLKNRNIYILSGGVIYQKINRRYALTITDNVYRYASRGQYVTCAITAFEQMNARLNGTRIPQPMKYICNALLALLLATMVNFAFVYHVSRTRKLSKQKIISHAAACLTLGIVEAGELKENEILYAPDVMGDVVDYLASDSDGGSSGGHGGGGFGGRGGGFGGGRGGGFGGHRGGGGHRFW